MLDFDANLLLLFNQSDFDHVKGKLEEIGYENVFRLEIFDAPSFPKYLIKNRINYIFTSIERLDDHAFIDSVKEVKSRGFRIPLVFLNEDFDMKVFRSVNSLPLADMISFDFREEDLIKSLYFLNYKKYNFTLGELKRKFIFVKKKKLVVKVSVGDIQCIKVEGKYLELYTRDDIFLVRSTLQNMLIDLPIEFIKVHQSYVVNIEKVDSFNPEENVININSMAIPISRKLKKVFLSRYYMP